MAACQRWGDCCSIGFGLHPGGVSMKLFTTIAALAALSLAAPAGAQAQGRGPEAQSPQARADALLAAYTPDRPGLAVLVARGGQVIYERNLGAADLEHGISITAASRFHVASVSKQFTAFAILQQVKAGKVDLDADIHTYLPELADFGAKITVSDLIHHTSGLRDQWDLEVLSGTSMDSLIRQKALVAMAANQRGLNFAPGTDYRYSNTGYSLLAEIVARTSGVPFAQYMREHIFAPLGMNDTLIYDNARDILPNRAMSYSVDAAGVAHLARLNYANYGATSLHTTTHDLLKWSRELLHPAVFDPALVRAAEQPGRLRDGTPMRYAFGMEASTVGGHRALTHGGADAGYRSLIASFPAEDASLVVFSNGAANVGKIGADLAEIFLGPAPPPPAPAAPDSARMARLAGVYVNDWGPGFELKPDGGKLYLQPAGPRAEAVLLPDSDFYVGSPDNRYTVRADGALVEHVATGGSTVVHRKVVRAAPSPSELAALAGTYHSEELDVTYKAVVSGRGLMLTSLRADPLVFVPADADHFENERARLGVLRDSGGRVTGLSFATGRVRDLRFARVG